MKVHSRSLGRAGLGRLVAGGLKKKKKKSPISVSVEKDDETAEPIKKVKKVDKKQAKKNKKVEEKQVSPVNSVDEASVSASDESDDEEIAPSSHKTELSKLKESDPEFYKFLQEEDADLLDFEEDDIDDEDEESEEEEKGETDEEEDEIVPEKEKKEKPKQEEKRKKKDKSKEEESLKMPKIKKDAQNRQIFDARMYTYLEAKLADYEKPSAGAARLAVNAFIACVARVGVDIPPPPWIVNDQEVFDALVRLCFRHLGETLAALLGTPEDKPTPPSGKLVFPNWKKHQALVKQYIYGVLLFVAEVQTPTVIIATLKVLAALAPLYAQYTKLTRIYIKTCVRMWTRKTLDTRCCAYIAMRSMAKARADVFPIMYKSCYMSFVACSREVNADTWPLLLFMHRSFAELTLANPAVAYQYAFMYIRQTAIHIRNAVISNKRKDLVQSVYNWQLVQCLYVWTKTISLAFSSPDTEALRELTYPLAQIIVATLKLFPSQRYLPLRVHCCTLLLQLQANCERYVPTLSIATELLSELVSIAKTKPKETKLTGAQLQDMAYTLKASLQQIDSSLWRKSAAESVFKLAVQSAHALAAQPAFPDIAVPICYRLRAMQKLCRSPELSIQLKNLSDALKEHADWVRATLATRRIELNDELNVIGLKSTLRDSASPLAQFYAKCARYWKMREAMLAKDDSRKAKERKDQEAEDEEREKKGKKEKGVKKARKEGEGGAGDREKAAKKKDKTSSSDRMKLKAKAQAKIGKPDATIPDTVADMGGWSDED